MPKAQIIEPCERMTRAEYRGWAAQQPHGRFERIDGVVVAMAPERVEHNDRKMRAWLALRRAVRDAGVPRQHSGAKSVGGRRGTVSGCKRHRPGMEAARILSAAVGLPLPDRLGRQTADRSPPLR